MITASNFGDEVIKKFPVLRRDIEEDAGLCHLQMATVLQFAENAARETAKLQLKECIDFIDAAYANGDTEVRNAINVTFLENIDPRTSIGEALFAALTPTLQVQWHAVDEYMTSSLGDRWRHRERVQK